MVKIKELIENIPDRIIEVYMEGDVTIVKIPNGRLKILPRNKAS